MCTQLVTGLVTGYFVYCGGTESSRILTKMANKVKLKEANKVVKLKFEILMKLIEK